MVAERATVKAQMTVVLRRMTPQFSGRALPCDARRERIMKWRARAVAAPPCNGPLQLLVRRLAQRSYSPRRIRETRNDNKRPQARYTGAKTKKLR